MNEEFITTREAAQLLGVSRHVVRELCRRGQIKGAVQDHRRGHWRIPRTSIEDWNGEKRNSQSSSFRNREEAYHEPPTSWQRFRYNPWVFYPTLLISAFVTVGAFFFAAISAGADLRLATQLFQEWGLIQAYPDSEEGEILIVVARFHRPQGIPDTEPHEKIKRAIENRASELGFSSIRVEVEPGALTQDDREEAKEIAKKHGARMIIWGEDTGVEVVVSFLSPFELRTVYTDVQIREIGQTLLARPKEYSTFVTQDLPSLLSFLSFYAIGRVSVGEGQNAQAETSLESAISSVEGLIGSRPEHFDQMLSFAYSDLGMVRVFLGKIEESIQASNEALLLDPQNATAYYSRSLGYLVLAQDAKGIADINHALELEPENIAYYLARSTFYNLNGEHAAALVDLSQAVKLEPESGFPFAARGEIYRASKEYEAAIADFTKAVERGLEISYVYSRRGDSYYQLGQYEAAFADFSHAMELEPENDAPYYYRGMAYAGLGQHEAAIADFSHIVQLGDELGYLDLAFVSRSYIYADLEQFEAAIADLTAALNLHPKDGKLYHQRGVFYFADGQHHAAVSDLSRAINLEPEDSFHYSVRGHMYSALEEYEAAITDYSRAIKLDPENSELYFNRGTLYGLVGQYELVIIDLNRALEIDPHSSDSYAVRGGAYASLGQLEAAIADLNRALELDPSNSVAAGVLASLTDSKLKDGE